MLQRPSALSFIAFLIASIVIATLSWLSLSNNLDMRIAAHYWDAEQGFYLKGTLLEQFFYYSINYSVRIFLIWTLIAYPILRYLKPQIKRFDRIMMACFLVLAIGPGVIVNSIFKDNFGRPRPIQSEEFGGKLESRQLFEANWGGKGKSFPSGHASVPLAFLIFACYLWRKAQRRNALILSAVTIIWYLGTSWARIVAGGHHFTDVSWAGFVAFVTVLLVDWLLLQAYVTPDGANNEAQT